MALMYLMSIIWPKSKLVIKSQFFYNTAFYETLQTIHTIIYSSANDKNKTLQPIKLIPCPTTTQTIWEYPYLLGKILYIPITGMQIGNTNIIFNYDSILRVEFELRQPFWRLCSLAGYSNINQSSVSHKQL